MNTTDDAFVDDILKSHREKVKRVEMQEHKQAKKKLAEEKMKSRLHAIRMKPETSDPIRYLQTKSGYKPPSKPFHRKNAKASPKSKVPQNPKPEPVARKRPPERPPEPPAKKKKLTPKEIEEKRRIKELTAQYYKNLSAGMPKELEELLRKQEVRKEEEEEEFVILDWKTNKPIKRVKEKKDKKPIAPPVSKAPPAPKLPPTKPVQKPPVPPAPREEKKKVPPKPVPMAPKPVPIAPRPHIQPPRRAPQPPPRRPRREEEYEDDSLGSFIEKDEEYDPLAYKELQMIKQQYRRGFDCAEEEGDDIPEATFDMIAREEQRSAFIGRREDELEELRDQRKKHFRQCYYACDSPQQFSEIIIILRKTIKASKLLWDTYFFFIPDDVSWQIRSKPPSLFSLVFVLLPYFFLIRYRISLPLRAFSLDRV
eukprot:TRINITY_DN1604_c0_g1_i9.p4 TRINITY_DN1604_c0_g1~~TRINITY_DN1604_c0_g1_i9.p4  ORF type:complete len:424 (+),score=58.43 TRINITY_DN1604_c0_g1_i9:4291-5562(+)